MNLLHWLFIAAPVSAYLWLLALYWAYHAGADVIEWWLLRAGN